MLEPGQREQIEWCVATLKLVKRNLTPAAKIDPKIITKTHILMKEVEKVLDAETP